MAMAMDGTVYIQLEDSNSKRAIRASRNEPLFRWLERSLGAYSLEGSYLLLHNSKQPCLLSTARMEGIPLGSCLLLKKVEDGKSAGVDRSVRIVDSKDSALPEVDNYELSASELRRLYRPNFETPLVCRGGSQAKLPDDYTVNIRFRSANSPAISANFHCTERICDFYSFLDSIIKENLVVLRPKYQLVIGPGLLDIKEVSALTLRNLGIHPPSWAVQII